MFVLIRKYNETICGQQKTQFHSSLRLNIEIFKNKIDNPLLKYSKLHHKNRHKLIEKWFFNEID